MKRKLQARRRTNLSKYSTKELHLFFRRRKKNELKLSKKKFLYSEESYLNSGFMVNYEVCLFFSTKNEVSRMIWWTNCDSLENNKNQNCTRFQNQNGLFILAHFLFEEHNELSLYKLRCEHGIVHIPMAEDKKRT